MGQEVQIPFWRIRPAGQAPQVLSSRLPSPSGQVQTPLMGIPPAGQTPQTPLARTPSPPVQAPQAPLARTPSPLAQAPQTLLARTPCPVGQAQFGHAPVTPPMLLSQVHSVAPIVLIVAGIVLGIVPSREQFATNVRVSVASESVFGNCGGSPNISRQEGKLLGSTIAHPRLKLDPPSLLYNRTSTLQAKLLGGNPVIRHAAATQASAMSASALETQPVLDATTLLSPALQEVCACASGAAKVRMQTANPARIPIRRRAHFISIIRGGGGQQRCIPQSASKAQAPETAHWRAMRTAIRRRVFTAGEFLD